MTKPLPPPLGLHEAITVVPLDAEYHTMLSLSITSQRPFARYAHTPHHPAHRPRCGRSLCLFRRHPIRPTLTSTEGDDVRRDCLHSYQSLLLSRFIHHLPRLLSKFHLYQCRRLGAFSVIISVGVRQGGFELCDLDHRYVEGRQGGHDCLLVVYAVVSIYALFRHARFTDEGGMDICDGVSSTRMEE